MSSHPVLVQGPIESLVVHRRVGAPEGTVDSPVLIGTALGFALGFERGLRGSPAGDRTFSLVGASAAAITAVFYQRSPQVVVGVVTGIGFIGGGVVLHGQGALIRGVTTAATVFATAALGTLVGAGYGVAATVLAALWGWHGLTDIPPGAR